MALPSVQFYGAETVLKAAENRDCPKWAIFQAKQFLFKYEADDQEGSLQMLGEVLKNLRHSSAVYTICFYEDVDKIKANTPHDGSFNFRMITEEEKEMRNEAFRGGNRAIMEKLEAIEQRLQTVEADDDEDDEEEEMGGIGGLLMGLIKEPEKLGQLIHIGKSLLGMTYTQQPGKVAGIEVTGIEAETLHNAIETLKKNDPKISEHLSKLAQISEKDPATFKYLVGMLDKM